MFRKIDAKWRYFHAKDIGVDADYIVLQRRFAPGADRAGWQTVGTANTACAPLFLVDGVKPHAELVRWAPWVLA